MFLLRYGPGGGQETKNALCVLGLNMINDKIFMVLSSAYFHQKKYHHEIATTIISMIFTPKSQEYLKNDRFFGSGMAS